MSAGNLEGESIPAENLDGRGGGGGGGPISARKLYAGSHICRKPRYGGGGDPISAENLDRGDTISAGNLHGLADPISAGNLDGGVIPYLQEI